MIKEHVKTTTISSVIVVLLAIVFAFFDRTISLGLLLGQLFYFLYLLLLTKMVDAVLAAANGARSKVSLGFILRVALLALPMVIAGLYPKIFNLFAVFGAMFLNRVMLLILYARGEEPCQ